MPILRIADQDDKTACELPDDFVVTAPSSHDYDCLGSSLGIRFKPGIRDKDGVAARLRSLGFVGPSSDADTDDNGLCIAVYDSGGGKAHVCKRLRAGWYESKCGAGLRIVHRLPPLTWGTSYGALLGNWVLADIDIALSVLRGEHQNQQYSQPLQLVPLRDSSEEHGAALWELVASLPVRAEAT